MKNATVFEDVETAGVYYIQYAKTKQEAWDVAILEYPEIMEEYNPKDMTEDIMYKCLDCGSYWIPYDTCGDCGEPRLSKRGIPVYVLSNFTL